MEWFVNEDGIHFLQRLKWQDVHQGEGLTHWERMMLAGKAMKLAAVVAARRTHSLVGR